MAKTRIKHPIIPVPRDLNEAAKFLLQIGKEERTINAIQSEFNAEVDKLKSKAMTNVKPHQIKEMQLIQGLFAFAESHRHELTKDGKLKTVKLPTGNFSWRLNPPSVSLSNVKSILKILKEKGLKHFIRTKEEINKEAMLKEPDIAKEIKGVSIKQDEYFIVVPAELEVEITTHTNKLKKVISK